MDNIRQELIGNFNTEELDKGENIIIKLNYTTITITTTKNQKNDQSNNITTINFEKCEEKIKSEYKIPEYKSLYILKVDAKQNGIKIPKIGYEVYYPLYNTTLIKLNLTVCFNTKIEFSIPINITYNLDKANSSSDYYKSICYTDTSNYGTDIPLEDRKREFINNNLTTCEEDCDFIDYNSSIGKAVCSCFVNTNDSFKIGDLVIDTKKLYKRFTNIKSITNINVLKCYNKVFNKDTIKANCGNIIIVCIALLFLASLITFWFKEYSEIKKVIKVITYFKLNPQVVTKFLKKSHKNENNNKVNKKKNKSNNKQLNKKEGNIIKDQHNLNIQYLDVNNKKKKKRKKEHKSNPIKKNKKGNKKTTNNSFLNNNNKRKNTDINSLNKLQARRNTKNIFNQIIYPDNLSEEQLYDLFLKIDKNTDTELNDLSYEIALKIDKRTYCQYYASLVRMKHLFFYSFWPSFDYNSRMVKIYLFFFKFSLTLVVNALFFNDETMHKIYIKKGTFDLIYNIPQIIYSTIISGFISGLISILSTIGINIIKLKQESKKEDAIIKKDETIKIIIIKLSSFFVIDLVFIVLFWFYLSCFCAVYKNTQIHLIKDTLISFFMGMIYPFVVYTLPGIFRIKALKAKKLCMFKFSKILQFF